MIKCVAIAVLWASLSLAQGAELRGRVVAVADGDTITVLDAAKQQHRVRLAGIDAPERGQPFGNRSRQNLAKWVHGQEVVADWHKRDQYGQIVGIVIAFGHDIGLEQVRAGMAWWYRAYAHEQRPEDRQLYEFAEDDAQREKRGLWAESNPVPPWEWRRKVPR
jgi:endonuclease YncB( thermonuclease family)